MSPDVKGILLVGHGTRDENGTREFFELAGVLADRMSPVPVEGCLLEFQHPTIPEAWRRLTDKGVTHIRVAPLLLFAAGHARSDIPDAVHECAKETPQVSHSQSGPLSRAATIVDLLESRIRQVVDPLPCSCDDESVALVMVGRGSYDPCAKADMRILGEIVARRCGFQTNETAFYAMAEPKLPEVLDQVTSDASIRTVIVQPHLLFQGRLYDAIERLVDEAGQRHPGVKFILGDYLGPTQEVADALSRRAEGCGPR